MRIRLHRDRLATRITGTALGTGFVAIGAYALLGGGDALAAATRERALGFGITAIVIGVIAVAASWLAARLDGIWCAPPRRIGWRRPPRPGTQPRPRKPSSSSFTPTANRKT